MEPIERWSHAYERRVARTTASNGVKGETMFSSLREQRRSLGVSLDELAAALGPGFSRARLSIAERGLIALTHAEQQIVSEAIERLGSIRTQIRYAVKAAQVDLVGYCSDLRKRAASLRGTS
jgi:hypothetical protein